MSGLCLSTDLQMMVKVYKIILKIINITLTINVRLSCMPHNYTLLYVEC